MEIKSGLHAEKSDVSDEGGVHKTDPLDDRMRISTITALARAIHEQSLGNRSFRPYSIGGSYHNICFWQILHISFLSLSISHLRRRKGCGLIHLKKEYSSLWKYSLPSPHVMVELISALIFITDNFLYKKCKEEQVQEYKFLPPRRWFFSLCSMPKEEIGNCREIRNLNFSKIIYFAIWTSKVSEI